MSMSENTEVKSTGSARKDGRANDALRPIRFQNGIAPHAAGSTLISWGNTQVICACSVEESVPRWKREQEKPGGWLTAEYSMLPYSTLGRKPRDINKGRLDGRSQEIQRLIGRSLRAGVDLEKLGERSLWIDCDVLQADGGTRTAAITGGFVALKLAIAHLMAEGKLDEDPIRTPIAAVSVGVVDGEPRLDLPYVEDAGADVDMNLVMTGQGRYVEVQGSGEEADFSSEELATLLEYGRVGIERLFVLQNEALGH